MSFQDYRGSPFAEWLLPIIPVGATLTAGSKIAPESIGKIPGLKEGARWAGFAGWTKVHINEKALAPWDGWYYPAPPTIGLQARNFPGIDLDVNDEGLAGLACSAAFKAFGPTIVRGRPNSPRQLLMYRLDQSTGIPIAKSRRVYAAPGAEPFAVEILGKGQQYLIEGKHPSGVGYAWATPEGQPTTPLSYGVENIPKITWAQQAAFIKELDGLYRLFGVMPQRPKGLGGATGGGGDAIAIGPNHPDIAPNLQMLKAAIAVLDVNDPEFADYGAWECILRAMKTASGGDEAFYDEIYLPWNRNNPDNDDDLIRSKWESHVDSGLGWDYLCSVAEPKGFLGHITAQFDNLDADGVGAPAAAANETPPSEEWQDRYAYIEPRKEFVDLRSPTLQDYDLQSFKLKFPDLSPWSPKSNAAMRYLRSNRKTVCDGYTYLPGKPRIVEEEGRRLVNRWSPGLDVLGRTVSEEEVGPFLGHVDYIIPDPEECETVLNWLAHQVQRRSPKVNYALLIGGTQGIGKSLLFDPVIRFLGQHNTRTTSEVEIKDKFTSWFAEKELVLLEEIRGLSDAELNRLKMYIAAPPYWVPVNEKHVKAYEVPNVARFVAFTNSEYALQLADDDRRWFVLWSPASPRSPAYYATLARWMAENAALVGTWLAQRDLSGFAAQGRAPMTRAKREMQLAGRNSLDYWVHEAIENGQAPFETDLVSVGDVLARLPYEARHLRPTPTEKSVSMALKSVGAVRLDRVSLGRPIETTGASRTVLWGVRGQGILRGLRHDQLVELFWHQRDERVTPEGFTALEGRQERAG